MRIAVLLVALIAPLACSIALAQAPLDPATMQPSEIEGLQRRLTDAKCFNGAIDGQASDALTKAIKACPDQRPVLRVETGMHVAKIPRIAVDRSCRLAATASSDKTVRLWSLPEERLLRTLRVPINAEEGGEAYATALSGDGRFVAVGGWDANFAHERTMAVYVFDAATGALVARVGAFENIIEHLVFSPDGRWLAATVSAGKGVRVIDTVRWQVVARDTIYGLRTLGAAFAPDGRLYTTSFDGKLRRYAPGPSFRKEAEVATRGGRWPLGVAIDPTGTRVAVGFADTQAVDLYDAPSLTRLGAADTSGVTNGNLGSVAWSRDGARFLAGGTYRIVLKYDLPAIVFYRDGSRRLEQPPSTARNAILDLQTCADGFAAATADPAFGLLDGEGRAQFWKTSVAPDMRGKYRAALQVSSDGRMVRFGLDLGEAQPVTFDLVQARLQAGGDSAGLASPRVDGLLIAGWENNTNPTIRGKTIKLSADETSRALAVRPDMSGFVLGAAFLRAFDANGNQRWQRSIPGIAWGVNVPGDGRLIIAAYGDGTIRWHRWSDGQELLALFVNKDTRQWVAWTPTGYYKASAGGEDMIGWHVNRGWEQAADFFPASNSATPTREQISSTACSTRSTRPKRSSRRTLRGRTRRSPRRSRISCRR